MTAVFKHELRSYFHSLTAYVFGAFLLTFIGIGAMLYNLQAGGQPLVVGQRGEKDPHGDQGRAQQEKGQDGAVGGKQIDVAELGEDQRIDRDDGQGDQVQHQQGQIFPGDDLHGGDGQGVEQLVGLLPALLRQHPHGQHGYDDHKD